MSTSLDLFRRPFFALAFFLSALGSVFGQTHPRLLFNATEGAALQAKVTHEPYTSMLTRIRTLSGKTGWASDNTKAIDYATLYFFQGAAVDAQKAGDASLHAIGRGVIFDGSQQSITRAYEVMHLALAYDLCANSTYYTNTIVPASFVSFIDGAIYTIPAAYVGLTYKAAISLALKNVADLLVTNGGSNWPSDGSTGNNWFSVRYGAALLCYQVTDASYDSANFTTALTKLRAYLRDNLTADADSRGWNPEGYGYNLFPARTTILNAIALKRSGTADLVADYPALRYTSWASLPGTLPIEYRFLDNWNGGNLDEITRGIHPDVTDDNPHYIGEGTPYLALAMAYSQGGSVPDFDYRSGIRWMIDRYWGATANGGNNQWDFYRGAGLLGLLYYPDPADSNAPASVNPSSVWGNSYFDPSYGVTIMRNRYQDAKDIVFQTSANARKNYGGHYGMDALAPRLIGLGVPWIVGPGRTIDAKGESTLLPSDPQGFASGDNGITAVGNRVHDSFLRTNGDGYIILKSELSDTGVESQTRRYLMDYSGVSGAAAVLVISDSSTNGKFWRLQTHGDNNVTTSGNTFTITGPGGQIMKGTVVSPASVTMRTGTFTRGSTWKTTAGEVATNKWVDFQNTGTNGEFLVVLTVNDTGTTIPAVTGSLTSPGNWTVSVPGRTFSGAGDVLTVSGWNRPSVAINVPLDNANYNAGATTVALSGTANDTAGGVIKKIEVYLDGTLKSSTAYNAASVNWSSSVPSVPIGEHALLVRAIDNDNDTRDAVVHVKVNNTVPPQDVAISSPGSGDSFAPGTTLILQGTAYDPENSLARVEIWRDAVKLGNATYTLATKTWTYSVPSLATGLYSFEAIAYDGAGDYTSSGALSVRCTQTFSPISTWGDASQYYTGSGTTLASPTLSTAAITSSPRWHVRDFEGDLRLHTWVGPTYDAFHSLIFRGTPPKNYTLRYKVKNIGTNKPGYNITITPTLNLQMRDVNAVFDTRAWVGWLTSGSCLWVSEPTGGYGYGGTVGFDTSVNGGAYTPTSTHAGVLGTNWTDVEIRKLDKNLIVKVRPTGQSTYQTIMNDTDFAIGGSGRININGRKLNDMGLNTEAYFDDIELIELDTSGNPVVNAATTVAFVSPVSGSSLTGSVLNIAATVADTDGIASVEYFAGSRSLGLATLQSGQWKLSWQYPPTGTHAISARVTDNKGNVFTSASSTVSITSQGGPVTAVASANPVSGTAPLPVTFSTTGSSSLQGSIVSYAWTFGDGANSTSSSPSHTYATPGIYTANLTLTDSVGNQGYASVQVSAAYPAGSNPVLIDDDFATNTTANWDILSATTLGTNPTEFYSATGGTSNFNGVGVLMAKGYHNATSSTQSALQFQSFGAVRDVNTATLTTTGIHSDKGQVYLAVRYFDGGILKWAVSAESIRTTYGSKSGGWSPVAGSWTLSTRTWKALDTANLNAGGGATLATSLVLTNADAAGFYSLSTGTWMSTGLAVVDSYTLANAITATAPAITQQPTSLTVTAGDSATFSVAASGYPAPAYQWKKNGASIAGATSSTYNLTATVAGDAGSYTVVVTNSEGQVTSTAATLTVNPAAVAPAITAQPSGVTVTVGSPASFTVAATGTPAPTYQWKKNGATISGATSATYTITATVAGDAGSYTVDVTNSVTTVVSSAAILTVNAAAPSGIAETFADSSVTAQWQFIGSNSLGSNPPTETWRQNGVDSFTWTGGAIGSTAWHSATSSTQATLNYRVLSGVTDLTGSIFSTNGIHARSSTAKFAVRYIEAGVTKWAVSTNSIRTTTGYSATGWAPVPGSWALSSFTWKAVDAANLSAGEGAAVVAATVLQNADAVGVYGLFTGSWINTKFPQITSFNLTGATAEGSGAPSGPPTVFNLETSSWISGPDTNAGVTGTVIQADGTILLAANLENATLPAAPVTLLGTATAGSQGAILRLSSDGRTLLGITRVAAAVYDLADDGAGNIYVAAGTDGALKLNATASSLVWTRRAGQFVYRIDAGTDGTAALLIPGVTTVERDNKAGFGTIVVINAAGSEVSSFTGYGNTLDVAVDSATSTVVYCGWFNIYTYTGPYSRGYNGGTTVPVDVPYFHGVPYNYGQAGVARKWMGHTWESGVWTDQANGISNPRWINGPFSTAASNLYTQAEIDALETAENRAAGYYQYLLKNPKVYPNNMADTRAYRCTMGRDGMLYVGYEADGGNTPLRSANSDLGTTLTWAEADGFFDKFYSTSTVNKLVIARYELAVATTPVEKLVFGFTNRLSDPTRSTTDNTIYMSGGSLAADEDGCIYIGGGCFSGFYLPSNTLPSFAIPRTGEVSYDPLDPDGTLGEYTGGSYLMVMNSNATKRLYTTRLGGGGIAAVDARATGANSVTRLVMGGLVDDTISTLGAARPAINKLYTSQAIQGTRSAGSTSDGFFSVVTVTDPNYAATPVAPAITAQPANVTITAGESASFSVTATGTPAPTYQWKKNGTNISGATSATYTIPSTVSGDAASYTVVVTNSVDSLTSAAATLTVNAADTAPTITSQPANVTVTAGASASFSVTATGTPAPTYQWKKNGTNISGATSANYTIASTSASDAASYTVVVTNSVNSITSSAANLTVNAVSGDLDNLLRLRYSLDETSGTIASDASVSANSGTLTGTVTWGAGQFGNALSFSGASNGYVTTASAIDGNNTTGLSASAWVRLDAAATTQNRWILQQMDGSGTGRTWLAVQPDGQLYSFAGAVGTAGGAVSLGVWHHVAITSGSGIVNLYLDGVQVATSTANLESNNAAFRIGNHKVLDLAKQWNGAIDEVRIYDGVLSATEIAYLATTASVAIAPTITSQPISATVTAGGNVSFTVTATGTPAPTFQWKKNGADISGATSATYMIANTVVGDAGNYTVVVTNVAGTVASSAATLTVNVPPAITSQPTNVTVTAGASANFTVVAAGSPTPSYQWKKNGVDISGASSATYTIGSTVAGDAASYTVVVTNSVNSVTSNAAVLTVNPANTAPTITSQPADVTVPAGESASFTVVATGLPTPTYQWKKNGTNISGATAAIYAIASTVASDAASYTVVVTNSVNFVTSSAATLTVNVAGPAVLFSTNFNSATSTSLDSVTVSGTSRGIAWTGSGSNAAAATGFWTVPDSAKVDLYGLPNGQITVGTTTFGAGTTNTGIQKGSLFTVGDSTGISYVDTINTLNMSGDYVARSNTSTLNDTAFGVLFEIKPAAGTYTAWQLSYNYGTNGGSWVNNTAAAQGSTTARIYKIGTDNVIDPTPVATFTSANLAGAGPLAELTATSAPLGTGVYLLKIDMTGKTNTQRYSIDNITLSVLAPTSTTAPAITSQPANVTVTVGASASFTVTATGTPAPTYQWSKDGVELTGETAVTLALDPVELGDAGTYTVEVSNSAGSATSIAATLTVNPLNIAPAITTQPANVTKTEGGSASFLVTATGTPAPTYQWSRDGVELNGATAATLSLDPVALGDAGIYTVAVTNVAGAVTSSAATLTVNSIPLIVSQPSDVTVTEGDSASFTVTATGSPTPIYQWKKDGTNISGATSATYIIASAVSGDAGSYTVVVTNGAGSVTSASAALTVNAALPAPVITSAISADALELVNFSYTITATGSPDSFGATGLPVGLTLDTNTGEISGSAARGTTGGYSVTLSATSANGTGTATLELSVTESWISQDIGSTSPAGSLNWSADGETATIQGAGADIYGTADAFHYARVEGGLDGDGEIIARVVSVQNVNFWTKAGVMFRETMAANSRFVYVIQRPDNMVQLGWRSTTGGSAVTVTSTGGTTAVKFLRLVRSGDSFSGYYSTISAAGPWTQIATAQTVTMASTVEVGLAVTSHTNGTLATAVFDSINLTGN